MKKISMDKKELILEHKRLIKQLNALERENKRQKKELKKLMKK